MSNLFAQVFLFAQEAADQAGGAADGAQPKGGNGGGSFMDMLPMLVGMIIIFWLFMVRPQQAERKKHKSLLENLKKNDQVQTIGGIIGTVVTVDEKFVTIKVDDNTRIKMRRTSIQGLLEDEKE